MTNKRKPLPWFAFNVADYVKDTMRLSTESHGAYLLLMLDYYGTGEPPPNDDFILAAICKLSEDAWMRHRRALEPFFKVKDGRWVHERIEREMDEAEALHAKSVKRTAAATEARLAKHHVTSDVTSTSRTTSRPSSRASSRVTSDGPIVAKRLPNPAADGAAPPELPKRQANTTSAARNVQRDVARNVDVTSDVTSTQTQTHSLITREREDARAEESKGDVRKDDTLVPVAFEPTPEQIEDCHDDGATDDEIATEIATFVAHHQERGTYSANWDASFVKWWARWKERKAKQPRRASAPMTASEVAEFVPSIAQWETTVRLYAQNQSNWPRSGYGPSPGMIGCKAPLKLLDKYGIDLKTGLVRPRARVEVNTSAEKKAAS